MVDCFAVEGLAAPGLVTLGADDAGAGVPRDEDSNLDGVALVFHDMIDYIKDNKLIAKVFFIFLGQGRPSCRWLGCTSGTSNGQDSGQHESSDCSPRDGRTLGI